MMSPVPLPRRNLTSNQEKKEKNEKKREREKKKILWLFIVPELILADACIKSKAKFNIGHRVNTLLAMFTPCP